MESIPLLPVSLTLYIILPVGKHEKCNHWPHRWQKWTEQTLWALFQLLIFSIFGRTNGFFIKWEILTNLLLFDRTSFSFIALFHIREGNKFFYLVQSPFELFISYLFAESLHLLFTTEILTDKNVSLFMSIRRLFKSSIV